MRQLPSRRRSAIVAAAATLSALWLAAAALADGGAKSETRATATCTGAAEAKLRLRAERERLRIEFELRARPGSRWDVIVIHERQTVVRAQLRAATSGGRLELEREIRDWYGTDHVAVRAHGPGTASCSVSAVV